MNRNRCSFTQKTRTILVGLVTLIGVLGLHAYAATPDFDAGFQNLPPSVHLYRYKGEPKRTLGFIMALPQLYVFDTDGLELLAHTGTYDHFAKTLDQTFSGATPIKGGRPLSKWLSKLTPIANVRSLPLSTHAQFTILEFWASWCEYCFVERDQLLSYFRKHPDLTIKWIIVDADKR